MGMGSQSKIAIVGNNISVLGKATSKNSWSLVSGIEVQNGDVAIFNNTIDVLNKAGYVKGAPVYGVSYAQKIAGTRTLDVQYNTIFVNGDYTVSMIDPTSINVTDNVLFAQKYYGDRSVYSYAGIVENNTPKNPYLFVEFDNITVGEDAVFNITFDANDSGNVSLIINGKLYDVDVTNGTGQVIVSGLEANEYTVIAYLTEVAPYGPDEFESVLTVSKYPTLIDISVDDVKAGQNAKVTIDMGSATGNVIAIIDGVEQQLKITRGKATTTISDIAAGDHSIVVIYSGDDNYAAAYNATTFVINKTETPISVNATPAKVGEISTITVDINDQATGIVLITINEDIYAISLNMAGSINVTFDKAGIYNVSATYLGDDYFEANMSDIISLEITEKEVADVNITLPVDYKIGEAANITVSIPNATGNVSVIVDGVETTVPLDENGTAVVAIPAITPGEHSVVVLYSGDGTYAPFVNTTSFYAEVFNSEFVNLTVDGDGLICGYLYVLGSPVANATITYVINGIDTNITTDEDGLFYFNATFPATVEIIYDGTDSILPSNIDITLRDIAQERQTAIIVADDYYTDAIDYNAGERGGYFKVQLVDEMGNPLANKPVKIGFNGKVYNATTNETGWAQLQINLAGAGTYTFAVAFLGDDNYNASFVVQKNRCKQKENLH
jgi:hypothetical protein